MWEPTGPLYVPPSLDKQDGPRCPRPHLGKDLCRGRLRGSGMELGPCLGSKPCAHMARTRSLGWAMGYHAPSRRRDPGEGQQG